MKKIIAAAAGLMLVGTMASSAVAVESQFGGYFRTRAFTQIDFDGTDSGSFARTDTRTRLYYTAVFNENFKFVNKFEFNNVFGDGEGGDIGADGDVFRVKNSYADFALGKVRMKVGTQGATIARGFIFADDFSGAVAIVNASDAVALPFAWLKVEEKEVAGIDDETDIYATFPIIKVSDMLTLNPYLVFAKTEGEDTEVWWAGIDVDAKMDAVSVWGTAIYMGGEVDANSAFTDSGADEDVSAWLLAAGGSVGIFHGQAFYATGDDDATAGSDVEAYLGAPGNSYYWSEIMGLGMFDNNDSQGSPDDNITNILAVNAGVTVKPMDKLTLSGDIWWAQLAEDDANGEDDLGVEVDLKATYALMDNLKLDLVAAYLFAGDATSTNGNNEEDPIEIGAQLSLSF